MYTMINLRRFFLFAPPPLTLLYFGTNKDSDVKDVEAAVTRDGREIFFFVMFWKMFCVLDGDVLLLSCFNAMAKIKW